MDIKFTQSPSKKPPFHFIMDYDYKAGALFLLIAGKAGVAIYNFLKWKKGMNGDKWFRIPNEHLLVKYGINRQRKSEALVLLEAEGLVETIKMTGKTTKVRLTTRVKRK